MTDTSHGGEANEEPQGSQKDSGGLHEAKHGEVAEDSCGSTQYATEEDYPLLVNYRFQVLQAIKAESDASVKTALIAHLEQEGMRELEAEGLARAAERDELNAQARIAQSQRIGLFLSSFIVVLKWVVPAAFAIILGYWMYVFYRSGNADAARSIRELLLLILGGTLGWVAKSNGGNGD